MTNERSQDESSEVDASGPSHCSFAAAELVNKTMMLDVDVLTDRFWVRDNYGDDAQVRLEPNGKVYLCYTAKNRHVIVSREIRWRAFVEQFRAFVDGLTE